MFVLRASLMRAAAPACRALTASAPKLTARPLGLATPRPCPARYMATQAQQTTVTNSPSSYREDEIIFNPMVEGQEQIEQVAQASMNSGKPEDSFARLNYHPESEAGVNEQIAHEYTMSYAYHAMSSYFSRDNVALPGLASFFRAASLEERSHAQMLMNFQATRGGRVRLAALAAPEMDYNHLEKGDALHAMELALALEKLNFQMLFELHKTAEKHEDSNMSDFLEDMLSEQAEGVKEVSDYVAHLRRVGKGLGVVLFDEKIAQRASEVASTAVTALGA
ncbi:hypothetical protein WJX81_002132 [Elliptochloris bilobata]|uniref:Ferritin n=1 Tax=Elliptochloris bilobata TaxID=381761 RepID=A0AAW1QJ43_9CHLO